MPAVDARGHFLSHQHHNHNRRTKNMGSRNRRRRKRARENAAAAVAATHFATVPVPIPAIAPTGGQELEQSTLVHGNIDKFTRRVSELLAHGWRVVPGTVVSGGGQNGMSQFVCVLELPPSQPKTGS